MNTLTIEVPTEFTAHCQAYGLTPEQVLKAFMADLGETKESNGSDERDRAHDWFDRVIWPAEGDV